MPSVTVVLPASLDAVLKQTAASHGRSVDSVVNTALDQYLAWRDCSGSNSAIRIGNIELDAARRLVSKNSVRIHLTLIEFDLLHYLMLHAGFAMATLGFLERSGAWSTGVKSNICEPTSGNCGRSWKMIPRNPSTCALTLIMVIDSRT